MQTDTETTGLTSNGQIYCLFLVAKKEEKKEN